MHWLKGVIACLIVGLAMGFLATVLSVERIIGFSPYFITIPAAFSSYLVDGIKLLSPK